MFMKFLQLKVTKKVITAGGILLILIGAAFLLPVPERGERSLCKGSPRPIPFKRLSDERNFPYLENGRPLSYWEHKKPNYDKYRAAVVRFPNARVCLISSEREKKRYPI